MATDSIHPAASHHLPSFITAPGETDVLMVVMGVVLVLVVLGFGILFLRLHTLPERIAHRSHKLQFEIVAVLGLISLFTHMHIFWIAGLLLALIDLPDIGGWLSRIALSLEKIAMRETRERQAEAMVEPVAKVGETELPDESDAGIKLNDARNKPPSDDAGLIRHVVDGPPIRPEFSPKKRKEPTHA
jgi:hypothetical protein